MQETEAIKGLFASIYNFLKEKEVEYGVTLSDAEFVNLTESELIEVFGISRTTLYRARKSGDLPFVYTSNGGVEYNYSALVLALKTNRFRVPNMSKIEAINKLEEYRNLKSLSYGENF